MSEKRNVITISEESLDDRLNRLITEKRMEYIQRSLDKIYGEIKPENLNDINLFIKQAVWVVTMGPVGLNKERSFFDSPPCSIRSNFKEGNITHRRWNKTLKEVKKYLIDNNIVIKGEMLSLFYFLLCFSIYPYMIQSSFLICFDYIGSCKIKSIPCI